MPKWLSLLLQALTPSLVIAGGQYEAHVFQADGKSLPYRLLRPEPRKADEKYPLVIFLHGAGERGTDNKVQLVHGSKLFVKHAGKYPAFVVFPQCPPNARWVEVDWSAKTPHQTPAEPSVPMKLTRKLIDEMLAKEPIDKGRIYVAGLSMGGFGTWDFAARYPDLPAAIAPICGGADDSSAERIKHIPVWTFHGDKDTAVWPVRTRSMVEALKKVNARVRYSEYPGVGHNSWDRAFNEPEFLSWMFSQKR